jgi:hypothetical protein
MRQTLRLGDSSREADRLAASRGRHGLIQITAIRLGQGGAHEHITDVRWRSKSTLTGQCALQAIVAWLTANAQNQAVVGESSQSVPVLVVRSVDRPPHLRTRGDGVWTDALLALPRF